MDDTQILDDTFERDPIRFPRDKRHRVRAFRYFIYAFILGLVWAYLRASYLFEYYSPLMPESNNRNILIGIAAARVAQLFYMCVGVFFLVKSILAKERNDGFKIGSAILLFVLFVQLIRTTSILFK